MSVNSQFIQYFQWYMNPTWGFCANTGSKHDTKITTITHVRMPWTICFYVMYILTTDIHLYKLFNTKFLRFFQPVFMIYNYKYHTLQRLSEVLGDLHFIAICWSVVFSSSRKPWLTCAVCSCVLFMCLSSLCKPFELVLFANTVSYIALLKRKYIKHEDNM